jgi:ribosomal protein L7/L12
LRQRWRCRRPTLNFHALHETFHEWYTRLNDEPGADATSVTNVATPKSPRVDLVLKEYAPDQKVNVIRVLRGAVPGCSLAKAKALVERELPAPIADGLALEVAKIIQQKRLACLCSSSGLFLTGDPPHDTGARSPQGTRGA